MAPNKPRKPLGVSPIPNEAFCYAVESESDPEHPYRVELEPFLGNGQCGCKDFEIRHAPRLADGNKEFIGHARCKHILVAREFAAYEQLDFVLAKRRDLFDSMKNEAREKNQTGSVDHNSQR